MTIKYRITKYNDKILKKMGDENYQLITIVDNKMYFSKKETKTRTIKKEDESKERLEFIELYRTINNKGSYDEKLIGLYKNTIKDLKHSFIIDNLKYYKIHLELKQTKPPLQVGTYLRQKRFMDKWEVVKVNFNTKWRDDILRERKIPQEYAELIILEANKWDSNHGKTKEMTTGIFENIINSLYNK